MNIKIFLLCNFLNFHKWIVDERISIKEILKNLGAPPEIIVKYNGYKTKEHCERCNETHDSIAPFKEHWKSLLNAKYECCVCGEESTIKETPNLLTKKVHSNYLNEDFLFCSTECLNKWMDQLVNITCPRCHGDGETQQYIEDYSFWGTCSLCKGRGQIQIPKEKSFVG